MASHWLISYHDAVPPLLRLALHDSPGVGGKTTIIITEVEPAGVPATIGRCELGWDVEVLPVLAHLESAAASPHRLPHARRARRLGGMPRLEEVEPQLPMGSNPQIPLADGDEDGRLCNGVGVEVMELHAIVIWERPHEPVRR